MVEDEKVLNTLKYYLLKILGVFMYITFQLKYGPAKENVRYGIHRRNKFPAKEKINCTKRKWRLAALEFYLFDISKVCYDDFGSLEKWKTFTGGIRTFHKATCRVWGWFLIDDERTYGWHSYRLFKDMGGEHSTTRSITLL